MSFPPDLRNYVAILFNIQYPKRSPKLHKIQVPTLLGTLAQLHRLMPVNHRKLAINLQILHKFLPPLLLQSSPPLNCPLHQSILPTKPYVHPKATVPDFACFVNANHANDYNQTLNTKTTTRASTKLITSNGFQARTVTTNFHEIEKPK